MHLTNDLSDPQREDRLDAEHRLQRAIDAVAGFVWHWTLSEDRVSRHVPTSGFLGYSRADNEDSIDWWRSRVHPDDVHQTLNRIRQAADQQAPHYVDRYRFRRKDGTYALVEDRVSIEYRDGKATHLFGYMSDITEREAALKLAETTQTRYRLATSLFDALVWDHDLETGGQTRTRPEGPFLGYLPSEIQDSTLWWQQQVHPDDLPRLLSSLEDLIARGGERSTCAYRFRRKDGTYATVEDRLQVLYRDGKPIRIVACMRDITESLVATRALERSERGFRQLAEATTAPVIIGRSDGFTEYVNPAYEKWSGYTLEAINELRRQAGSFQGIVDALVSPDTARHVTAAFERFEETQAPVRTEFQFRRPSGELRWVDVQFIPLDPGPGATQRYVGTFVDIEEQRAFESALRAQAEQADRELRWLEFVLDAIPTPLMIASTDAEVLYINVAFRELCKGAHGLSLGLHDLRSLVCLDSRGNTLAWEQRPLPRVIRGEAVHNEEHTYITSSGRATLLVSGVKLPAIHGRQDTILMSYQDVDRLKQVERELRDAVEAKDRFLAVLSHELRTPLTPVLSLAQMLEQDPDATPAIRETATIIRRNVELETRLIDDLLDLTRIARGKLRLDLKAVDVRVPIQNVLDICDAERRGKSIDLTLSLPDQPLNVRADSARLHQVFWNLVKNAIKFTGHDGRIDIHAETVADRVVVRVRDNGIGIPASLLPRVFDAFVQGDHDVRHHGGLGLGLAIAKALVEMHNGELIASSAGPGRGVEFVTSLPLLCACESPCKPTIESFRSSTKPLNILLTEDHADTARVMARLLRKMGHQVTTVDTVAAAINALTAGGFDLLISDIGLPDGSGRDILHTLQGRNPPAPPAIAISGYGMDDDLQRSADAGFFDHLTKPVDAILLENTIRRAIASK